MPGQSMKVTLSSPVYAYIAEHGQFGETVDDVLRRLFGISGAKGTRAASRRGANRSVRRVSPEIVGGYLNVRIEDAGERRWQLPSADDTVALRRVTHEALDWASSEGATEGQLKAIRKAMSEAGYFIGRPRRR